MQHAIVLTSAVVGLTQAFKIAGVPNKYCPTLAVIIGMIMQLALAGLSAENAITGIVIGLSAVGLYESGTRIGDYGMVSGHENNRK
ncbi:phage holin family protein [Aedoeadaptatus acetigenes]|uniref:phage holin family protein n=1 Tax=Aedoeadaptatus acetigenes TaxID=2981723 RepID=UPI0011DCFBA1|nr:phage holin family protein [Aedoeadaptatus acetigenes]MCU6786427.1 phage holin family protein [Aedoeadaptatus acetigenes]